jgi:hypothetical protein
MTIEDLEKAVSQLKRDDLARFRAWFDAFDSERFDKQIESDAKNGKLDQPAEGAQREFREGRSREL